MGVKQFFPWVRRTFPSQIQDMKKGENVNDKGAEVDVFMIDMNGLYHSSAQFVYKYGNHKPFKPLMKKRPERPYDKKKKEIEMFKHVCDTVDGLARIVRPKERLVLCVDGPAPLGKQYQQRSRRFRSAMEKTEEEMSQCFDSNCLTPGTQFMDNLSRYIDWYIRKKLTEDSFWQEFEVIFSSEKAAKEGEQKLIEYIRDFGSPEQTYCIHGLDADIIMLSLATHMPKFYVIRDDLYNRANEFFLVDIGGIRPELVEIMRWKGEFNEKQAVNDFVFICFMVGNDFLPHIPSLEIIQGGIEVMLDVYRNVCPDYGHLTFYEEDKQIVFSPECMKAFIGTIGQYEKGLFDEKLNGKNSFFPDNILDRAVSTVGKTHSVDINKYREEYMKECFPEGVTEEDICHTYLEGMQWVITYYSSHVPNWQWFYPYNYAPFASHITKYIDTYERKVYGKTTPSMPFQQLISVLPPQSASLIPPPLSTLLTDPESSLAKFCPKELVIDLAGKRKEWEGIVILPMIEYDAVKSAYEANISLVPDAAKRRNRLCKSFIYFSGSPGGDFKSYFGDIPASRAKTVPIII